jgi:hypothetical protein
VPTCSINVADLAHLIPERADIADDPHPFGDVVSDAPEVDDIAGGAKPRCLFDKQDFVA